MEGHQETGIKKLLCVWIGLDYRFRLGGIEKLGKSVIKPVRDQLLRVLRNKCPEGARAPGRVDRQAERRARGDVRDISTRRAQGRGGAPRLVFF